MAFSVSERSPLNSTKFVSNLVSWSIGAADTKIFAIWKLIFLPLPKDETLWNASLIFFKRALIRGFKFIGFDVEGMASSGGSSCLIGLE